MGLFLLILMHRNKLKRSFFTHFANRFSSPSWPRIPLCAEFLRVLNVNQCSFLEVEVSLEEIKRAVWDCATDKSLGPDGFTFDFFGKYWSLVDSNVAVAVLEFF